MTTPPLIEFRKVVRAYGQGETEVRALDGVDLIVEDGEFVAVMGPSGSGKSTMMNILGCLDMPTDGSFLFRGLPVETLDRQQRALLRRNYLGFVFQGFNLLKRTTALQNVELPLIYRGMGRKERRDKARAALEMVGLANRETHTTSELSGGQQQRVAIARALVADPDVLLCDEPTGDLDRQTADEILTTLQLLNKDLGKTIIMVTHDPAAAKFAKRELHLNKGQFEERGVAA